MEAYQGYIVTAILSLLVGYLLTHLQPKSKLSFWIPHTFTFNVNEHSLSLATASLTLQNLGRKQAEKVEILHRTRPDFFQFSPAVNYSESTTPEGHHVISIDALGPQEFVTLQMVAYKTQLQPLTIRSKDGLAKPIPARIQRVLPMWMIRCATFFMAIGIGFAGYWIARTAYLVVMAISKTAG